MKEFTLSVSTKKKDTMLEIIKDISQYDCEIKISKEEEELPYSFNFSETAYHKLGEKRGRTVDEYKRDLDLYNYLSKVLKEYGISEKHKGFRFAIECIRLIHMYGVEKYTLDADVYPIVSKWYDVTQSCIEHNIRNAISTSWNHNKDKKIDEKNKMSSFDEKPTNLKFLRHVADRTNYAIINAY